MRVTIDGTADQIADAMSLPPPLNKRRVGLSAKCQREAVAQRMILRRALDAVRNDPAEKLTASSLARALGGSAKITDTLLATARQIIGEIE